MFSFRLLASFILCLAFTTAAHAAPQIPPAALTGVCSAIVYDLDNDAILFEQNADERIPPASLTKVLSMFLALDFIKKGQAKPGDPVLISPAAANAGGSRMGLRANETVPFGKLLLGMAVSSGNDASHAVAERVGGSAEAFVNMMNTRASLLGMEDSHFVNPHGMPAVGQYTTARDMLTLARAYLIAHPNALEDYHNTLILEHGGYRSWNKNPLIGQYPGADGLKTGWIRASGYNLIFTAQRNNRRLLAVILGAPDAYARGAEACRLLDAGFLVCSDSAVSIAAALDSLPPDLNRIDPRKTAREHGIYKPRMLASQKIGKYGRRSLRIASKMERALASKKTVRSGQKIAKKSAQGKALAAKAASRQRIHAEKKGGKAKRG